MEQNGAASVQMPHPVVAKHQVGKQSQLAAFIISLSLFNLLLVSFIGVLLRAFPFLSVPPFDYKNLLHGHSHFAFGGWIMPMLLALLLKIFPELTGKVVYTHWRNITILLFSSAYG